VEAEIYFKFILSFALVSLTAKLGGEFLGCYLKRSLVLNKSDATRYLHIFG